MVGESMLIKRKSVARQRPSIHWPSGGGNPRGRPLSRDYCRAAALLHAVSGSHSDSGWGHIKVFKPQDNRPHLGVLLLVMHGVSDEITHKEMSPLHLENGDISLFEARLPAGVVRYELQAAASCGRPPPCGVPSL